MLCVKEKCHITKKKDSLSRYFYGLNIRLLNLFLGDSDSENSIFHRSLHLINFDILRQSEPPHELATATLHTTPRVIVIFLLKVPLSADLKNPIIFNMHLYFLLLEARNINLEHVRLWGLLPIHLSAHKCRILRIKRSGEMKILEGVPHVQGQRIQHVTPSPTEKAWDQRHLFLRFQCVPDISSFLHHPEGSARYLFIGLSLHGLINNADWILKPKYFELG
ncbi:hypothetical protein CR513_35166, partial [Mucuna pruriens]